MTVYPGPLLLGALLALAVPALWAGGFDSCSEAAWWAPLLGSTVLAAAACFSFWQRRGHPVLGVVSAVAGGFVWFWLALLATLLVWLTTVPERCDVTIWGA